MIDQQHQEKIHGEEIQGIPHLDEQVEIEDNSSFGTQEGSGSMVCSPIEAMEDFSKELCPKNESPSKYPPIDDSRIFKEIEERMVSSFQETTKIHDENHTSVAKVKHSSSLAPLISATNDVDVYFADSKVGHNILIGELENKLHASYEKYRIEIPMQASYTHSDSFKESMFDDGNEWIKSNPMLDEASLGLQVDSDIKCHIQKVEDHFSSKEEYYDGLWLL